MIVCCRLFLCLNPMPPGVSGALSKTMLSCDIFFCCTYPSLCVLTACVLANKGVQYCLKRDVFSDSRKVFSVSSVGPATENARRPSVVRP